MSNKAFLIVLLIFFACGTNDKKIPLAEVDSILLSHGDDIISDFLVAVQTANLHSFREKGYITPMVHRGLISDGIYTIAPMILPIELGEGTINHELIQVLDKGLVYHMTYKLTSEKVKDNSRQLAIDINKNNGLAKIYFFIKNDEKHFKVNKDWVNLFSNDILLSK